MLCVYLIIVLCLNGLIGASRPANIILVVTDDQDLLMGSLNPLKKTQSLIANNGVTFSNAYVSTPLCCPSRASILSGKYQHNHKTLNNSLSGGCSNQAWQEDIEPRTFAAYLHKAGYRTFYAGKYLNEYGNKKANGTAHVPPGWDWWIGLVGNSKYYNYDLSVNGTSIHLNDSYLTSVIESYAQQFLDSFKNSDDGFLMVLAPPAPHAPFTPEPKYKGTYAGIKVPRTPNYNIPIKKDRHWLMRMPPSPLPPNLLDRLDDIHASRWETLLSVDDLISSVFTKLDTLSYLNNTYFIITSDHGFHLGQFSLAWDKRQLYETDIKVPMLMYGPGIKAKQLVNSPVLNIDIAPTLLDIAGLNIPDDMDGISILPLVSASTNFTTSRAFMVEYSGEGNAESISDQCQCKGDDNLAQCTVEAACKCQDARNNTYDCLRRIDVADNFIYCEFPLEHSKEVYDLTTDPYQLYNIAHKLSKSSKNELKQALRQLKTCKGDSCKQELPVSLA